MDLTAFTYLQDRCFATKNQFRLNKFLADDDVPYLFATNAEIERYNLQKLAAVKNARVVKILCSDDVMKKKQKDKTKQKQNAKKYLYLCVGAKVVLTKNLLVTHGLTNGAEGIIVGILFKRGKYNINQTPEAILVKFRNRKDPKWINHLVEMGLINEATYDLECVVPIPCGKVTDDQSLASVTIPLKLAWGKSIHKAQGETYNRVIIKLPDIEFAKGLTLVALSRARTAEGMIIQDISQDILVNKVNENHSNDVDEIYENIKRFIFIQNKTKL